MGNQIQDGRRMVWVNATEKLAKSGLAVIVGDLVGVAVVDIQPGQSGVLALDGVFDLPKGAVDFAQGERCTWKDGSVAKGTGVLMGHVFEASPAAAPTVQVRLAN